MSQKKWGVLLSYLTTAITALMNIVFVPFYISKLGAAEYGVYKIMNSFSGYLIIMDMGIGTIVTRYVSLYRYKKDDIHIKKCISTSAVVCIILSAIVLILGLLLQSKINNLYGKTFSAEQLFLARHLFILMVSNIVITLVTHLFTGYINAHEQFAFTNGFSVIRLLVRIIAIYLCVSITRNSLTIIILDIIINFTLLLLYAMHSIIKLKMEISIKMFDRGLLKQYTLFSGAILFQSIVNQVNNSVDNMILGAMVSPEIVTMYSSGLTIYGLYVTLPDAINHVFLPQATRLFGEKLPNDNGYTITNFVSRIGRYEAIICLGILGAFFSFGKEFVYLWIGNDNIGAWSVALLLIIPVTIPMCENLMVTVLNACNKRMFRSVVLACVAVFNIITTIILIPKLGYIGAAIGTFLSILIGHGIVLNIYYNKAFNLRVILMLKTVYLKLIPCCVLPCIVLYIMSLFINQISWLIFIIKGFIFLALYLLSVYIFYLSKEEKGKIVQLIRKTSSFFSRNRVQ
jgi:O-antigen/teichoic acid export membrane protein